MKYLKKFQNESELNSYINSSEFIKPNLCAVVERVGVEGVRPVIFTPEPNTITFTIDGIAYEADPGMYWHEWLISKYNTIGLEYDACEHGCISYNSKELKLTGHGCVDCYDDSSDLIVENGAYYLGSFCSPR